MTGFEVYQMYLSLKLHFTKDDYDYFRFNGKTRASQASFDKRNDAYFFKKLPIGESTYKEWKRKQESFLYNFREEIGSLLDNIESPYDENFDQLFICSRGRHPILLTSYLRKEISVETLIIFENCLGYVKRLDKTLTDPVWKQVRTQVIKYAPFLKIDCKKYKSIILKVVKEKV